MDEQERLYSMEDFRKIIETLRSEHGCPWDKVQTHGSMKGCMIDEAAEAVAAIKLYDKTGNSDNLKEELGDVLMQVVLQSKIAEEEGLFTLDDVITGISSKMIRRHPHVFEPDGTPLNGREPNPEYLKSWKEVKEKEKAKASFKERKWKRGLRKIFGKFFIKIL